MLYPASSTGPKEMVRPREEKGTTINQAIRGTPTVIRMLPDTTEPAKGLTEMVITSSVEERH